MEDFEKLHEEKTKEMKEKYKDVINQISKKHGVDVDDAYYMLQASVRGGNYAEGIEFDKEELEKDMKELEFYSLQNAIKKGLKV